MVEVVVVEIVEVVKAIVRHFKFFFKFSFSQLLRLQQRGKEGSIAKILKITTQQQQLHTYAHK